MRYIKDLPHSLYKIGLYQWNGKYIIKIEAGGMYEQTYKVEESELDTQDQIQALLDGPFIDSVTHRFKQMHQDFQSSLQRHGIIF